VDVKTLIAEDETIIRLDLRKLLEASGFSVCAEARDGLEAVELALLHEPKLAIIDVKMPKLDGIEAARRIFAQRPIPIVMLTAYAHRELVARAIGAGVFAYVVKPYREQDLLPAIETALARHDDLLRARREYGRIAAAPNSRPVDLVVSGNARWPLRLQRRPDGALDVSVLPDD
jgi:response regulator NasT